MMNLSLSKTSIELLPAQLALNGTFEHRLVTRGHAGQLVDIVPVTLEVQQGSHQVHLSLRIGHQHHSSTLPTSNARLIIALTARNWIEDCANGRLEAAA